MSKDEKVNQPDTVLKKTNQTIDGLDTNVCLDVQALDGKAEEKVFRSPCRVLAVGVNEDHIQSCLSKWVSDDEKAGIIVYDWGENDDWGDNDGNIFPLQTEWDSIMHRAKAERLYARAVTVKDVEHCYNIFHVVWHVDARNQWTLVRFDPAIDFRLPNA
jgi:hypothetical protein